MNWKSNLDQPEGSDSQGGWMSFAVALILTIRDLKHHHVFLQSWIETWFKATAFAILSRQSRPWDKRTRQDRRCAYLLDLKGLKWYEMMYSHCLDMFGSWRISNLIHDTGSTAPWSIKSKPKDQKICLDFWSKDDGCHVSSCITKSKIEWVPENTLCTGMFFKTMGKYMRTQNSQFGKYSTSPWICKRSRILKTCTICKIWIWSIRILVHICIRMYIYIYIYT